MPDLAIIQPTVREGPLARLGAGVCAAACLAVLITAWRLQPSAAGHGTHTQLGLPACGFALAFNKPCFTCGMTTAFAHAAHGQFWAGFKAQPFGLLLSVATAGVFWGALHVALTGSRVARLAADLCTPRRIAAVLALGGVAWVYKILTWPGI